MNTNLTDELNEIISTEPSKFKDDLKYHELEMAVDEYKKLIKSGLVKPRGYNLLTFGEAISNTISFNTINKL
ncbi:MAG: hypothetical protein HW421_484 [Ignavibacteria bacterium]|nr:hypothetical protein [Ignavibacteria bacterium]